MNFALRIFGKRNKRERKQRRKMNLPNAALKAPLKNRETANSQHAETNVPLGHCTPYTPLNH